jgi:hypothetical protein
VEYLLATLGQREQALLHGEPDDDLVALPPRMPVPDRRAPA